MANEKDSLKTGTQEPVAGETGEASGNREGNGETIESIKAEIEKLKAKNAEILNEKKTLAQKLKERDDADKAQTLKAAEEANNWQKAATLYKEELKTLREQLEAKQAEEDRLAEQALGEKRKDAFVKELGAELVHPDFLNLVQWKEIAVDPSVKDRIAFIPEGMKKEVERFKKTYPAAVKASPVFEGEAAKGAKATGSTYAERKAAAIAAANAQKKY